MLHICLRCQTDLGEGKPTYPDTSSIYTAHTNTLPVAGGGNTCSAFCPEIVGGFAEVFVVWRGDVVEAGPDDVVLIGAAIYAGGVGGVEIFAGVCLVEVLS